MTDTAIETERLLLRPSSLADYEESYAMASDPEVVRFLGVPPATREETWNKLLRNVGHWTTFSYGVFTIRDKTNGAFLGETGLANFHRGLGEQFDGFPEAAWVLATAGHGRGYATEAVTAAHDWLHRRRTTERTVCIIHPDNAGSLRLAEKLNYKSFGTGTYRGTSVIMFERTV